MALSPALDRYDQLILDLDGCVWVGPDAVPGSIEAIAALREAGKRIVFATNDPRHSAEDFVQKLWRLGAQASLNDVVTVGAAMQHLLATTRRGRTAFVIGTGVMIDHVATAGLRVMNGTDLASRAEVVVVAGTDRVDYDDLRNAALAVRRGADFLGSSRDPTYPMPDGAWPGTGALLAAVETAAEREAVTVGKPEPQLFITAIDRLGEGRTLVVGDRLDTDIAAAGAAKLDSALVLTGGTSAEQAEEAKRSRDGRLRPTLVAESLAALVNGKP